MAIHESELTDIRNAIAAAGFKPADFTIEDRRHTPCAMEYSKSGTVTITRCDGPSRTYRTGTGSICAAEAQDDLKAGVYGRSGEPPV